jgi:hypothetical protein
MPVTACNRATRRMAEIVGDIEDTALKVIQGGPVGRGFLPRVMQSSNWIRTLSAAGEELASSIDRVSREHQRLRGVFVDKLNTMMRGVSTADRIAAAKVADGVKGDFTPTQVALGQKLKNELLDPIMKMAQALDGYRITPDGKKVPIKGSGRAFPTVYNKAGREWLDAASKSGDKDARVLEWAQKQVAEGKAESIDAAIGEAAFRRENSMRRKNHYLEALRSEIDPEFREWDPLTALPDFLDQQALHLAGAREWGWNLEAARGLARRVGSETRDNSKERLIVGYLEGAFGIPSDRILKEDRALLAWVRLYMRARIFGGTFVGPLRNLGQPYTNTPDVPLAAHVRALKDYPPVVGRFVQSGQELRREALRAGANPAESPMTGFAFDRMDGLGDTESLRSLQRFVPTAKNFVDALTTMHDRSVKSNNYRAAVIAKYGLEENVNRLIHLTGDKTPIGRAMDMIYGFSVDPEGAARRAIERRGVDPDAAMRAVRDGKGVTPEMVEAAMFYGSTDSQFGYTLASAPIFSGQSPLFNTLFFLKQFGIRQTGFIYEHVLKEMALGNAKPMVKFIGATFALGEAYNLARDIVSGSERSMTMNALFNPANNSKEAVAFRFMRNVADGGGLGLLQDVVWGFTQFIGGPIGGTFGNGLRGAAYIVSAPPGLKAEATGRAIVRTMDREFVATGQWTGIFRRALGAAEGETPRFFEVNAVRQRGYEWLDQQRIKEEGWSSQGAKTARDFVIGRGPNRPGERTIFYENMSAAITRNDARGAEEAVRAVLRETPRSDRTRVENAFRTSMNNRSPLGMLNQEQKDEFLNSLSASERARLNRIDRDWRRDASQAIDRASRNVR